MSDLLNDNVKQSRVIPLRFTRLFVSLLVVLTVLLTVGQAITQWRLNAAQDELWVIRYAALQRHQSQQIVLQALQVANSTTPAELRTNVAELRQVFTTFERYHLQGRQGHVYERNVAVPNSDTIQRLYTDIRPEFAAFQRSAQQLTRLQRPAELSLSATQTSLQQILANEKPFLEEIDGIVRQYTTELRTKLTRLQTIEFYLYVVAVLVLLGIGLLIFRPAARRLRETVAQLIDAESRTTAANRELLDVNRSLSEARRQLFEATRQQYQQEINDQKLRTSYLITGQEEERKRLSRELHDGLGQMLTAIKLQVEGLEAVLRKQTAVDAANIDTVTESTTAASTVAASTVGQARNLRTLKTLITQTIQETRTISNNLMPTVLSDFGLLPALKQLVEDDRSETIDVQLETNLTTDDPRLDRNVEIMLYRVTQEALSNAIRHAQPSHIRIELIERGNYLHLLVSDDGRGFVPVVQRASKVGDRANVNFESRAGRRADVSVSPDRGRTPSQGLHNMQERAKLLNGKLRIWSAPGSGTRVQVSIPYQIQPAFYETY